MYMFLIMACSKSYSISFDTQSDPQTPQEECIPSPDLDSLESPSFYLGAKVFIMNPSYQSITDAEDVHQLSMNTVGLLFALPYGDDGAISYPYDHFGVEYNSFSEHLCKIGNMIYDLKKEGVHIYLSIEPHYVDKEKWPELSDPEHSGPPKLTSFQDPNVLDTFLEDALPYIASIAEMSDRYNVELLAPITEPAKYFGLEPVNTFMQNAIDILREYSVQSVWQVYGEEFQEPNWEELLFRYDFRGFDVLGLAVLGCDQPYEGWDRYMDTLWNWAQEDEVPYRMHAEFGCIEQAEDITVARSNFQHWYERTEPDSLGLIMLERPHDTRYETGIKDTWLEEWMKSIAQEQGITD